MNNKLFIILPLITLSFLFSTEKYNYIYLMEFENVNSDFTINNLSRALPDIIIQNFEFRGDLIIEYLKTIDPYFPDKNVNASNKALIINGRFISNDDDVDIEVEIYDSSTWDMLVKKSFYCPIQNTTCIHDAFLITIDEMLKEYIVEEETRALTIGDNVTRRIVYSKEDSLDISEIFKDALSSNVGDAEFNINLPNEVIEEEEVKDEFISKEFDFTSNKEFSKTPLELNTEELTYIFNEFLTNPYNVIIGEMDVQINEHDRDLIDFTLPLEFAINKDLVDALLLNIPNNIIYNKNGNLTIELSNNNFIFDQALITKLATMKYQVIPLYSFIDKNEEIQLLIIDTWEKKYKDILIGENKILHTNQYTPLFAIKSDSYNIYINLDVNTTIMNYSFSVPYNTFGNYTKLIVKFMMENELDQYLNIQYGSN